ncbi:MAG: hypothetical protein VX278_15605 [Myxococcota bacterium]|nr:hypothetical protein [Myxococcota bacterium]
MSYILILSLAFAKPETLFDITLDKDVPNETMLSEENAARFWNAVVQASPASPLLYAPLRDSAVSIRLARAQALFLNQSDASEIQRLYDEENDPDIQATLLLALGKHGNCQHLPTLERALTESSPIRLPPRTKASLYALALLAEKNECDYQKSFDLIFPMINSFSTDRRKGASYALAEFNQTMPSLEQKDLLHKATLREPNPSIRANLVAASKYTNPTASLQKEWFSDTAREVRMAAMEHYPNNPLVVQLLKDNDLAVQQKAIETLGKTGGNLQRLIDSGANIDAEQKARISNSRLFSQSLHALQYSTISDLSPYWKTDRPTAVRRIAVSKVKDSNRLREIIDNDTEPEVQIAATKRLLSLNPENLTLLSELLEHPKINVQRETMYFLQAHPEGALEQQLWSLLESNNTLIAEGALGCLSRLELDIAPEEAQRYIENIAGMKGFNTLLPLRRISNQLQREAPPIPWPKDIERIQQATLQTERGDLHMELYPQLSPLAVWSFADLVENGEYDNLPLLVEDGFLTLGPSHPFNIFTERNFKPVRKGSIILDTDPIRPRLRISLRDQPLRKGDFIVIGQIVDGLAFLDNIRSEERSKQVKIYRVSR